MEFHGLIIINSITLNDRSFPILLNVATLPINA